MFVGGDGTSLDEELVNAHQTNDVPTRDVFNWLSISAHHENGPVRGRERAGGKRGRG